MLACLAFAIVASPLLAAEATAPSEQDISKGLRPAPKGLGAHQGTPIIGTVPGATKNPTVHDATLPSDGIPSPLGKPKRAASGATTPHVQPSTEPRPAFTFNTIQFTFGSAEITPESSETLRNLGNALNHGLADQKAFVIEGHTDRTGTRAYNDELSKRRADAVKDCLINQMGVSADRLQSLGKGFSEPADPRHPYAAENRRVRVVNPGS
jgi:OmpA-OmpF porin, OOP family